MRLTGTAEETERDLRIVADVERTDGPTLVLNGEQAVTPIIVNWLARRNAAKAIKSVEIVVRAK